MSRSLLTIVLAVLIQICECQQLNTVIPPSPTSTQFQRYTDYPVDYSSGIPAIDIPVYTIKCKSFEIPITLSYHATGFKPTDVSGFVGLGWVLNAGGRVSRTVVGKPDELNPPPSPLIPADQIDFYNPIHQGYVSSLDPANNGNGRELDCDVFYYNALSTLNGRFVLRNGQNNRTPVLIPFRPIKVSSNSNLANSPIDYFEMVDESGTLYRFGQSISTGGKVNETTYPSINNAGESYRSAWLLTDVVSADKTDTVSFYYGQTLTYRKSRIDQVESLSTNPTGSVIPATMQRTASGTYENYVTSIKFKSGRVELTYDDNMHVKSLNQITIFKSDNTILQSFKFNRSFYDGSNPIATYFKLDSFDELGKDGTRVGNYTFEYTNPITPNVPQDVYQNTGIDLYGFYNGKINNNSLLPNWTLPLVNGQSAPVGSADRSSDETAMKTYILSGFTTPLGAKSEFDFEANRISDRLVGGLRIRQISTKDPLGKNILKTYKYGTYYAEESGYGVPVSEPSMDLFISREIRSYEKPGWALGTVEDGAEEWVKIASSPVDGSGLFENSHLFYPIVSEINGSEVSNAGKTVYEYNLPSPNGYSHEPYSHFLTYANPWNGSQLRRRSVFKTVGNNFQKIAEETMSYLADQTDIISGLKVLPRFVNTGTQFSLTFQDKWQYFALITDLRKLYYLSQYSITSGRSLLSEKMVKTFNDVGQPVVTNYHYGYSAWHNNAISISTLNSKGEMQETITNYAPDTTFQDSQETVRLKMTSRNILNQPLVTTQKVNGNQIELKQFLYNEFNGVQIQPWKILVKNGNNPIETRLEMVDYDKYGNLTEQNKPNDLTYRYIWGYRGTYPIAELTNIAHNQKALCTSFEDEDFGGWQINPGSSTSSAAAITGTKSFSGAILTSNIVGDYILSLWANPAGTVEVKNGQNVTQTPIQIKRST